MRIGKGSWVGAAVILGSWLWGWAALAHAGQPGDCAALVGSHPGAVQVESAVEAASVCVARGIASPYTAADGRAFGVRFELRLPKAWNGKFYFQGGGGLDGSVAPAIGAAGSGPSALARGYAVLSMDGGHEGGDAAFASEQQARLDYAYQAIGKATAAGKLLIRQYYGGVPKRSYFVGCSNGGREAMLAVQRYPLEFDGAVAGAPGFRLSRAAVQEAFASQTFARIAPRDAKGEPMLARALTDQDLALVSKAVLKACDSLDGLADGLISNPAACRFEARSIACKAGETGECLAPAKAAALDAVFAGAKDSHGKPLYSRFYWDSGVADPGWRMWVLGIEARMPALNVALGGESLTRYFMTPPAPGRSPYDLDLDQLEDAVAETGAINDATSSFIGSFTGHGGKLILYHGVSDPVFSAADTVRWVEAVRRTDATAAAGTRLFLVPGMTHCGGGVATDQFDLLSALEDWVEKGVAPDQVTAKGGVALPVSRPLCAWPTYARYQGGDPKTAASFRCTAP
jgi:Tannase and feruloyl esterase